MADAVNLLMLEFLSWVSNRPRTYTESMEAWRTTCPRHTIWEDALIEGLIRLQSDGPEHESKVVLTALGRTVLDQRHNYNSERTVARPMPNSSPHLTAR